MYLVPFRHFVIDSPYNKSETLSLLEEHTEVYPTSQTYNQPRKFIDSLDDDGFKIQNKLHRFYENDFNPVAKGTVTEIGSHGPINGYFRPTFYTCVFMLFFLGFAVKELISSWLELGDANWVNFVFLLIGYLLMQISFWIEANKLENNLRHLLESHD
ncbi:MAG: hypothetical protein R3E90_11660 [Marinicella sp.]